MPHHRFYVDLPLETGQVVSLRDDEAHHLSRVMRSQVGDIVELVNGKGSLATASIIQIERHSCELKIAHAAIEPADTFKIVIAQALPRLNRLDSLVEKCTELGMSTLWLFPGDRSERKELSHQQQERLKAISVAAMKQCGRLYLPEIVIKPRLREWQHLELTAFYGATEPDTPLFSTAWQQQKPTQGTFFFVGPEAGLSEAEMVHLQDIGAVGVSLHRNTLRTDTAPIVALTLIDHFTTQRPCKQAPSQDRG